MVVRAKKKSNFPVGQDSPAFTVGTASQPVVMSLWGVCKWCLFAFSACSCLAARGGGARMGVGAGETEGRRRSKRGLGSRKRKPLPSAAG